MRAKRAAAYLDMGVSKFFQLVKDGRMPRPVRVDGVVTWDRLELDAAYDALKGSTEFNVLSLFCEFCDMSTSELELALERETNPKKRPYYQHAIAQRMSDPEYLGQRRLRQLDRRRREGQPTMTDARPTSDFAPSKPVRERRVSMWDALHEQNNRKKLRPPPE